jgi:organic hydroperoxide reductase OsmC/OhrA
MVGTLNGALEVRGIKLPADALHATVLGFNEMRDRIPMLARIELHYRLRIPHGTREVVERALNSHKDKCPTARTLEAAVEVRWSADIEEEDAV